MTLEAEAVRVDALSRSMLEAYVAWGDKLAYGETYHTMYGDLIDFASFRIETADACLILLDNRHVADALGLCRALLENYLLLMLMCRGSKYFQLQDLSGKTEAEFREQLKRQINAWKAEVDEGKTNCIDVRRYPRRKRHVMFVYAGLQSEGGQGFKIPLHYFQFQEFRPETMRLDGNDYFEYYERDAKLKKVLQGHRAEAKFQYQHYLSYEALLECLELNEIADEGVQPRIEAHYTFLGRFLHPPTAQHATYAGRATGMQAGLILAWTDAIPLLRVCLAVCTLLTSWQGCLMRYVLCLRQRLLTS